MIDPVLNRSLEETKELHARWSQFRDFCLHALKTKKVTAQAELKFLELKSRIAMLHDGFLEALDHDEKVGQNIMNIVQDSIMLRKVVAYNDAERHKFEFDWNECFMLLMEQISHLEEEKERLAGISERAHKAVRRRERMRASIHNFLHGAMLKFTITISIIIFIFYIFPTFIWSYRGFYDIGFTQKIYLYFANNMYRPIFKEYEHDAFQFIPLNEKYSRPMGIGTGPSGDRDKGWLVDVELPVTFKFQPPDVAHMKVILDNMVDLKSHVLTYRGAAGVPNEARAFYLFFRTTKDAREFTDLVQEVHNKLEFDEKKSVSEMVGLYRSANFVGIGTSIKHPVGPNHPREYYAVWKDDEPSLLKE
jgi:hypothetical protein